VGVVLGRGPVVVAVALVRQLAGVGAVLVREAVAVAVAVALVRQLAVVLGRKAVAVASGLVHKPAAVAMGIVVAASIEPVAQQRRHSSGYWRDTPRCRTDYRRHGYSPLSAPSAVAAAPMGPSPEARVCQR